VEGTKLFLKVRWNVEEEVGRSKKKMENNLSRRKTYRSGALK
jgi:hypothetical protein